MILQPLIKKVAGEIEKEFDGALPCGDDMVRAERLRGSILKNAFEGKLT